MYTITTPHSEAFKAAELNLKMLELEEEVMRLNAELDNAMEENLILRTEMAEKEKTAKYRMERALEIQEAKHKDEMKRVRKDDVDCANNLIGWYVQEILTATGNQDVLDDFRKKDEERHKAVEEWFNVDTKTVKDSEVSKVRKRRQATDQIETRNIQAAKRRRVEMEWKHENRLREVKEVSMDNYDRRKEYRRILDDEVSKRCQHWYETVIKPAMELNKSNGDQKDELGQNQVCQPRDNEVSTDDELLEDCLLFQ